MHKRISLWRSVLLLLACAPANSLLRFDVNLDDPPRQRFRHIAQHWAKTMHMLGPDIESKVQKHLGDSYAEWKSVSESIYDPEQVEEMNGILDAAGAGPLTLTQLRLVNMLYEMGIPSLCSGVLTARPDGLVVHGRNLDFPNPFNVDLETVTFDVTFHKGGEPLYAATMWPGFIAFSTGMRFPSSIAKTNFADGATGWSWQQNARAHNDVPENLKAFKQGGGVAILIVRKMLENIPDYKSAVTALYDAKYMAPMYFVVAGTSSYEGSSLSLDRLGQHLPTTVPIVQLSADKWFMVQTNEDQTLLNSDLVVTDMVQWGKENRRPWANARLAGMKDKRDSLSVSSMLGFMHTAPLLDGFTVYTTVMAPKSGYYQTFVNADAVPQHLPTLGTCDACAQLEEIHATALSQQRTAAVLQAQQAQQQVQSLQDQESGRAHVHLKNPTRRHSSLRGSEELPHPDGEDDEDPSKLHAAEVLPHPDVDVTSLIQLSVEKPSSKRLEL